MTDNIEIRLAIESDCREMLDIYAPFVMNTAVSFEYTVPSIDEFRNRIEEIQKKYPWIVCEIDHKVVGYAYASPFNKRAAYDWSVDYSIYVNPDYHGMKIGTALYTCLTGLLKLQGFYTAFAGVASCNKKSENFHKTFGFKSVGIYHNAGYKFNSWYDVQWFEYKIAEVQNPPEKLKTINEIKFTQQVKNITTEAEKIIKIKFL